MYGQYNSNAVDVIYTILPLSDGNCEGNVFTVTVTINPGT